MSHQQSQILLNVYKCRLILAIIWDKVFKKGPSKICGREL